jgi:CheY-like chemotaxis protein
MNKVSGILIVDDDPIIREMLATALFLAGDNISVITAADGLEALQLVKQMHPALIILDVMMPRMDGPAFIDELERTGCDNIPIILFSAHWTMRQLVDSSKIVGFLPKPFELETLQDMVRQAIAS